jgi:hypothetical protein
MAIRIEDRSNVNRLFCSTLLGLGLIMNSRLREGFVLFIAHFVPFDRLLDYSLLACMEPGCLPGSPALSCICKARSENENSQDAFILAGNIKSFFQGNRFCDKRYSLRIYHSVSQHESLHILTA